MTTLVATLDYRPGHSWRSRGTPQALDARESPDPVAPAVPATAPAAAVHHLAGVDGVWELRAWQVHGTRRYELRVADDLGQAGIAAAMNMLPDGLSFLHADLSTDAVLCAGRPELVLEFVRPTVP